jgi:hypothetical protein
MRLITYIHNVIGDPPGLLNLLHLIIGISTAHAYVSASAAVGLTQQAEYRTPDGSYLGLSGIPGPYVLRHFRNSQWTQAIPDFMPEYITSPHRCGPQIRNNRRDNVVNSLSWFNPGDK